MEEQNMLKIKGESNSVNKNEVNIIGLVYNKHKVIKKEAKHLKTRKEVHLSKTYLFFSWVDLKSVNKNGDNITCSKSRAYLVNLI